MGLEENKVQKEILEYINKSYYKSDFKHIDFFKLYRINNIGIRGRKSTTIAGFPDLSGYVKSSILPIATPVYVEIKAKNKKCTNKDQLVFLEEAAENGCYSFWTNSLEDFIRKLKKWLF